MRYPWGPPTWGPPVHLRGPWPSTTAAGSAKPGRGGRRKRKADRAKIRARIGVHVERKGWPLRYALRSVILLRSPAHPLNPAHIAALAAQPVIVLLQGFEFKILAPTVRGRRERRRRAKLRRRRGLNKIRRAARAAMLTLPAYRLYQSSKPRWFWRELKRVSRRKLEQVRRERASPTPGI